MFHFHNGDLTKFVSILCKSYEKINHMSHRKFFKKFDSLNKYENYAVNIFKQVINQCRKELKTKETITINTRTGQPDCFTIAPPRHASGSGAFLIHLKDT